MITTDLYQKIIPTVDELKMLRSKLNNIKDLYIFKNMNQSISHHSIGVGQTQSTMLNRENADVNNEYSIDNIIYKDRSENLKNLTGTMNNNLPNNQNNSYPVYIKNSTNSNNLNNAVINNELFIDNSISKDKHVNVIGTQNLNSLYNLTFTEKEYEMMNHRYIEMHKFIEMNKEKIEQLKNYEELLKENKNFKLEIEKNQMLEGSLTFSEILKDFIRIKSENISLIKKIEEDEEHILKIEKENKILRDMESNIPMNKQHLRLLVISLLTNNINDILENEDILKYLTDLFGGNSINIINLLSQRIDSLELQNFQLITKIEKSSYQSKNYLNDLIEYSEVISDITNVLNQVYDTQSLTTEFLIIRETLNNRRDYIFNQRETFIEDKLNIETDSIKETNLNVILCRDKILESKINLSNNTKSNPSQNNKIFDLLDEKIELYESMKNNLAQYEDFINKNKIDNEDTFHLAENLMNENYILKSKNIRLIDYLLKFLKSKNLQNDINLDDISELNGITNTHRDIIFSEDLFNMVKAQALIIENNLISK